MIFTPVVPSTTTGPLFIAIAIYAHSLARLQDIGILCHPTDRYCYCRWNRIHVPNAQLCIKSDVIIYWECIFIREQLRRSPINCEKLVFTPSTAHASRMEAMIFTPAVPSTTTGPLSKPALIIRTASFGCRVYVLAAYRQQ